MRVQLRMCREKACCCFVIVYKICQMGLLVVLEGSHVRTALIFERPPFRSTPGAFCMPLMLSRILN